MRSCLLHSVLPLLLLAGCAGKDDRFGTLVRTVVNRSPTYLTQTTFRLKGPWAILPKCTNEAGDSIPVTYRGDDILLSGFTAGTQQRVRCETPTEISYADVTFFGSSSKVIGERGFSAQGEIVSGAIDCWLQTRSIDYNAGSGRLTIFGSGNFPCYSEYDGANWRSTRFVNDIRSVFDTSPSSDMVSFSDSSVLAFDDAVDDFGKSRDKLRMWSCKDKCLSPSSWTPTVVETVAATGLAAAVGADGKRVAVSAAQLFGGSRRPVITQCNSGASCSDVSAWTTVTLPNTIASSFHRTDARFDADGNLWVFIANATASLLVCPADSFPCATAGDWRTGVLPAGGTSGYVRAQRPAFASTSGHIRIAGTTLTTAVFAECVGTACAQPTSGVFTNFNAVARSGGIFPTLYAYLHIAENAIAVHYSGASTPFASRWQRCEGAFGLCNDPASPLWSAAAPFAFGEDFKEQAIGQQRPFTDDSGRGAALLTDEENDVVTLQFF